MKKVTGHCSGCDYTMYLDNKEDNSASARKSRRLKRLLAKIERRLAEIKTIHGMDPSGDKFPVDVSILDTPDYKDFLSKIFDR
jgi:hypothetical protein